MAGIYSIPSSTDVISAVECTSTSALRESYKSKYPNLMKIENRNIAYQNIKSRFSV